MHSSARYWSLVLEYARLTYDLDRLSAPLLPSWDDAPDEERARVIRSMEGVVRWQQLTKSDIRAFVH